MFSLRVALRGLPISWSQSSRLLQKELIWLSVPMRVSYAEAERSPLSFLLFLPLMLFYENDSQWHRKLYSESSLPQSQTQPRWVCCETNILELPLCTLVAPAPSVHSGPLCSRWCCSHFPIDPYPTRPWTPSLFAVCCHYLLSHSHSSCLCFLKNPSIVLWVRFGERVAVNWYVQSVIFN